MTKCPESIEELEELERRVLFCRRELYEQAQSRMASGSASSIREAARQLGEELGRSPGYVRIVIQREEKQRVASLMPVMQDPEYDEELGDDENSCGNCRHCQRGSGEFWCTSLSCLLPPDLHFVPCELELWDLDSEEPEPEEAKPLPRGALGTGENEWYTPTKYVELARQVLGEIDLDPASSEIAQQSIQAASFFTKDDNGLEQEWQGKVWLNPPYMQPDIALFVDKLVQEYQSERVSEAILLTHNYTDTAWFHKAENACSLICFTKGRIRFVDAEGNLASPTQGQAFFYFGPNSDKFREVFVEVGFVR